MSDRAQRIGGFVEWVAHRPVPVLIVCTLLAVLGGAWAGTSMGFKSDRSDLVDPTLDWQRRYRDFKATFPNWDDAIVVVEHDNDPARVLHFFEGLEREFDRLGMFPDRTLWIETDDASPNALLLEDDQGFAAALGELRRSTPLLAPGTTLESTLRGARRIGVQDQLLTLVRATLAGSSSVLEGETEGREPIAVTDSMAIGFVSLDTSERGDSVNDIAGSIKKLRTMIGVTASQAGLRSVGVTGIPVIESDETRQSTKDAAIASALSFLLIALLLAWVYRGLVIPLFALGALLLGVAWSFGWLMLSVGHLQVLSVVFAIVLLGLGVDGAIHLIARLELVHPDHDHLPGAIGKAAAGVGPGILTGTLTTAFAFGATALSPFTGVAEMGLIASGGVALCTLAILIALPALLALLKHPERHLRTRPGGEGRPYAGRLGLWIDRHPWKIFGASAVVITLASLCTVGVLTDPIRYDPDLIALMPPKAEGVEWERRLREADERSSWHAIVVAPDRAEAERLTHELSALRTVDRVGGAGALFVDADVLAARAEMLRSLPEAPETVDTPEVTERRVTDLRALLTELGLDVSAHTDADLERTMRAFQSDRERLAERLRALRSVEPVVTAQDLPPALRDRVIAPSGAYLLRVYPAPKDNLGPLHPDRLDPFVESVLRIAPSATGPAVQVYESTVVILDGYKQAALYAAIAIVVLLLIDFRNPVDTLCALLPVIVGVALLLGAMAALGLALNFANTIVMPLLLGIGVDAGVHAVHRWRTQPNDAPAGLAGGTGRAITLTTLTTAIGFACMMIGEHRGVRSLGLVMTLGLTLTWIASVFVLPPLLRLRTKARTG